MNLDPNLNIADMPHILQSCCIEEHAKKSSVLAMAEVDRLRGFLSLLGSSCMPLYDSLKTQVCNTDLNQGHIAALGMRNVLDVCVPFVWCCLCSVAGIHKDVFSPGFPRNVMRIGTGNGVMKKLYIYIHIYIN